MIRFSPCVKIFSKCPKGGDSSVCLATTKFTRLFTASQAQVLMQICLFPTEEKLHFLPMLSLWQSVKCIRWNEIFSCFFALYEKNSIASHYTWTFSHNFPIRSYYKIVKWEVNVLFILQTTYRRQNVQITDLRTCEKNAGDAKNWSNISNEESHQDIHYCI